MKKNCIQTSLGPDKQSYILQYGANIGELTARVTWQKSYEAMMPNRYPAEDTAIEISLKNSSFRDDECRFWEIERANLQKQFAEKVQTRLATNINHLSVFALAPQPLLIELGRLLSDVSPIDVYQHQKEPEDNWKWHDGEVPASFKVIPPEKITCSHIALNMSLSARIDNQRILSVLGEDVCIWTLTTPEPYNDFLKTRGQLKAFREIFRRLLNNIKLQHGQQTLLHLFPAVPVSIAVETGLFDAKG